MHYCCCGLCLFMGAVGGRRGPPDMFIVALGSGVAGGPQVQSFTWAMIYSMVSMERGETEGGAESRFQGQTGGFEFKAAGGLFFNLIFWLLTESHVQLLSILHQLRFCFSSCESLPAFTITCSQPHPPNAMVVLRDQMHWNWKKKAAKANKRQRNKTQWK